MPETSFYGAPQEVNRRSFSLANALQERLDLVNVEVRQLQAELQATYDLLADANFELASNEAYDKCLIVLAKELKVWRDEEPSKAIADLGE
jgi:hypothetical protein